MCTLFRLQSVLLPKNFFEELLQNLKFFGRRRRKSVHNWQLASSLRRTSESSHCELARTGLQMASGDWSGRVKCTFNLNVTLNAPVRCFCTNNLFVHCRQKQRILNVLTFKSMLFFAVLNLAKVPTFVQKQRTLSVQAVRCFCMNAPKGRARLAGPAPGAFTME